MPSARSPVRAVPAILRALRASLLDHLVVWVLAAVAAGLAFPALASFEWLILPALFVMVASISLTQGPDRLQGAPWATAALLAAAGALLPLVAWAGGTIVRAPDGLVLGLIVFFASPPELTTPVLTRVARGDVPLSLATLLLGSGIAVVVAPSAVAVLGGTAAVGPLVRSLLAAVVIPMAFGTWVRSMAETRLRRHDDTLAAVSAGMLAVVMLLVAAQAQQHLFADPALAGFALAVGGPLIAVAALGGHAMGALEGGAEARAGALSLGIRDFAVAAALIVAADLPREGAVAALALGIAELVVGSWGAGQWRARDPSPAVL